MPDTLSISLVPGYLPAEDELIDNAILRLIARPTVTLIGSIGSATLSDGSVTTAKIADGALSADATGRAKMADEFLTAAKLNATQDWTGKTLSGTPTVTWSGAVNFSGATFTPPAGMLVQSLAAVTTAMSTLTSAGVGSGDLSAATSGSIPLDDTIPTNTEGALLLTQAITPKSVSNVVEVEVLIPISNNSAGGAQLVATLLRDGVCVGAAQIASFNNTGISHSLQIVYRGSISATTFTVRVGTDAGTLTINGYAGVRRFGGVSAARLIVREIAA